MPKLDRKTAKEVEAAQAITGGGFLLEPGRYAARLAAVEETDAADASSFPYWTWEYEALHDEDGDRKPGRQWNTTSLSPKSKGFLKGTFEAFGYSADSDTDEMIGEWVVLLIDTEVQKKGANAGKMRNFVNGVAPFDPEEWDFDPEQVGEIPKGSSGADADAETAEEGGDW